MDPLSDVIVTPTVTSTISPVFTIGWSDRVRQRRTQNPKVTPTPSKDRQTPVAHVNLNSNPVHKYFQSYNLSGLFT